MQDRSAQGGDSRQLSGSKPTPWQPSGGGTSKNQNRSISMDRNQSSKAGSQINSQAPSDVKHSSLNLMQTQPNRDSGVPLQSSSMQLQAHGLSGESKRESSRQGVNIPSFVRGGSEYRNVLGPATASHARETSCKNTLTHVSDAGPSNLQQMNSNPVQQTQQQVQGKKKKFRKKENPTDLILNKSNSSYVASYQATNRNSITNRESNQASNLEVTSRIPALNIEIVQKQTERQRLIQQMLQPGDQYGIEQHNINLGSLGQATVNELCHSVAVNSTNKINGGGSSMLMQHPPRHAKIYSDAQQNQSNLLRDGQLIGGLTETDLYGFQRAERDNCNVAWKDKSEHSPLSRKHHNMTSKTGFPATQQPQITSNNHKTRSTALDNSSGFLQQRGGAVMNQRPSKNSFKDTPVPGSDLQADSRLRTNQKQRSTVGKSGFLTSSQVDQACQPQQQLDMLASKSGTTWNHTSKATQRVGFLLDHESKMTQKQSSIGGKKSTQALCGVNQRRTKTFMQIRDQEDEPTPVPESQERAQFRAQQERFKHQLKELHTMGNEIARLKNENRRTKTSIQRMKSFHNQRKLRGPPQVKDHGTNNNHHEFFMVGQDFSNELQRRRIAGRDNHSNLSNRDHSDRRRFIIGGEYSQDSRGGIGSDNDSSQLDSNEDFISKRKSVRAMKNGGNRGRSTRNYKDRVSTANGVSRRSGGQYTNGRLFAKDQIDVPMMKHTDSKIDLLYERLKQCQGDGGIVDPAKVLDTMNMVQIEEDPDAYVPNIEKQHRRREEIRKAEKWYEEQCAKKAYDQDKALFDFDESVDNLSQVSERYAIQLPADPAQFPALQGEDLHSTEEQGKVKDNHQGVQNNEERPSPLIEACASRKEIPRHSNLNRHKSDKTMTPKLSQVQTKGLAMFDPLRRSKISDAELKEEIIRDLTDSKSRKQLGTGVSRKNLKREQSSQFSNYVDKHNMNMQHRQSNLSELSGNHLRDSKTHMTHKITKMNSQIEEKSAALLRNHTDQSPSNNNKIVTSKFTKQNSKQQLQEQRYGRNQKRTESKNSALGFEGGAGNRPPKAGAATGTSGVLSSVHNNLTSKQQQPARGLKAKQKLKNEMHSGAQTQQSKVPQQKESFVGVDSSGGQAIGQRSGGLSGSQAQQKQLEKNQSTQSKFIKDMISNLQTTVPVPPPIALEMQPSASNKNSVVTSSKTSLQQPANQNRTSFAFTQAQQPFFSRGAEDNPQGSQLITSQISKTSAPQAGHTQANRQLGLRQSNNSNTANVNSGGPTASKIDQLNYAMPLFQLETGVMSSGDNQRNGGHELKKLNQSSTINTRLNSSQKTGTANENLHLSSALSEVNIKQQKKPLTNHNKLGSNPRNSISNDSNGVLKSPRLRPQRRQPSVNKQRKPLLGDIIENSNHNSNKLHHERVLSGAPKNPRLGRHTKPTNSLSIGPQPHINRLKRFYCDSIDKQNVELAGKINSIPNNFSQHLKSLISDRLNSAKGSAAPGIFQNLDTRIDANLNQPQFINHHLQRPAQQVSTLGQSSDTLPNDGLNSLVPRSRSKNQQVTNKLAKPNQQRPMLVPPPQPPQSQSTGPSAMMTATGKPPSVASDKDHNSLFQLNDAMGHELRIFFNKKQQPNHNPQKQRTSAARNGLLDRTATSK